MIKHCPSIRPVFAIGTLALLLGGCATQVHFESSPPGARVVYEERNLVLGTTPFDATIYDDFGWFSTYRFSATLDGHETKSVEFHERTPLDAQLVVPPVVSFDLQPRGPARAAPAPGPRIGR